MENGYEIFWSKKALFGLNETYIRLEEKWTEKEIVSLSDEIERTINLISQNPYIFQETNKKNIRRAVVLRLNSIFYHVNRRKNLVTILTFFSNRQDPNKINPIK